MAERKDSRSGKGLFGFGGKPQPTAAPPAGAQRPTAAASPIAEALGLNLKAMAAAASLAGSGGAPGPQPPLLGVAPLSSRPACYGDVLSGWYAYWAGSLGSTVKAHRKLWEFIAVLQAFYEAGVLCEGMRALSFGAAGEPLPSFLAAAGLDVVATDLPGVTEREAMFYPSLVDGEVFDRRVEVSNLDMRQLDDATLRGFDACWSCGVLNEMSSADEALDTAIGAMDVLRPGGVAVHTIDFAFADELAFGARGALAFPMSFFTRLAENLRGRGHTVSPVSFSLGDHPLDGYVDLEPFEVDGPEPWQDLWASEALAPPHLKLMADGVMKTSFVFIARARD